MNDETERTFQRRRSRQMPRLNKEPTRHPPEFPEREPYGGRRISNFNRSRRPPAPLQHRQTDPQTSKVYFTACFSERPVIEGKKAAEVKPAAKPVDAPDAQNGVVPYVLAGWQRLRLKRVREDYNG